jgi:hypothetical protein
MGKSEIDRDVGRRIEPRVRARLYAQLVTPGELETVYIESLSSAGAGLSVETLPPVGSEVVLSWQSHDMPGTVVWARGRRCGLNFSDAIPPVIVEAIASASDAGRYVRDLARTAVVRKLG